MERGFDWRRLISNMARWSPLAWAFIMFALALLLVWIESSFTRKLAILPTVIGILLFYQAVFRGKMY